METLVERAVIFLSTLFKIVLFRIFLLDSYLAIFLGFLFLLLLCLVLVLLKLRFLVQLFLLSNSIFVVLLSTRKVDNSPEPLTSEDKHVPETNSLLRIEQVEPKLVLLSVRQTLAPHCLQHVMHAMVSLCAPSWGFDGLELHRILACCADLSYHELLEKLLFCLLLNRPLDLGNEQGHQVRVLLLHVSFLILYLFFVESFSLLVSADKGSLLMRVARNRVNSLPEAVLLLHLESFTFKLFELLIWC